MSKSTLLKDLKPPQVQQQQAPMMDENMAKHQHNQHQHHQHQQAPKQANEEDMVVNEVLSEISAENKQNQPNGSVSPNFHPSLFQQQMLHQQQLQQLVQQQHAMLQQQQEKLAITESFNAQENKEVIGGEELSTPQKLIAYTKHLFTTDNHLLLKTMALYMVFQYVNVMSVLRSVFTLVKMERFFTPLEDNKMIEKVLTAFVYALSLVILKPMKI